MKNITKQVFLVVVLVFFIFSFSVSLVVFNKQLAFFLIEDKSVASDVFDFFQSAGSFSGVPDVFDGDEKSHLVDVKDVFSLFLSVLLVSSLFLLVLLPLNYKSLIFAGVFSLFFLFVFAVLPWSFSFDLMHNVFFEDNWSFSSDSVIIGFFPETLFQSYAVVLFLVCFLVSVFFIITGIVIKKNRFFKS